MVQNGKQRENVEDQAPVESGPMFKKRRASSSASNPRPSTRPKFDFGASLLSAMVSNSADIHNQRAVQATTEPSVLPAVKASDTLTFESTIVIDIPCLTCEETFPQEAGVTITNGQFSFNNSTYFIECISCRSSHVATTPRRSRSGKAAKAKSQLAKMVKWQNSLNNMRVWNCSECTFTNRMRFRICENIGIDPSCRHRRCANCVIS